MIRVIRVIEYEFTSGDQFERHCVGLAVPLNGVKVFGDPDNPERRLTIRSATVLDLSEET